MKKLCWVLVSITLTGSLLAQVSAGMKTEEQAIRQTSLDYVEGWFTGNTERMDRALHPRLVKRAIAADRETGELGIRYEIGKEQMMKWTAEKGEDKRPAAEWNIKVEIFDVLLHSASVKITSCDYNDYAHMVKLNGEWKILNVIWEYPEKK